MKITGFFILFLVFGAVYQIVQDISPKKADLRIPAQSKVDHKVTTALNKLKDIQDFATANQILAGVSAELNNIGSSEAKSMAKILTILANSEGILYRSEPVLKDTKLFTVSLMSAIKQIKTSLPSEAKAAHILIDRLFIPVNTPQFKNIAEVQKQIVENLIPNLNELWKNLKTAQQNYPLDKDVQHLFSVDIAGLVGQYARVLPEQYKEFKFTSAHLYATSAEISWMISHLYYFSSYQLEKYSELMMNSQKAALADAGVIGLGKFSLAKSNRYSKIPLHKKLNDNYYKNIFSLSDWAEQSDLLAQSKFWLLRHFEEAQDAVVVAKNIPQTSDVKISDALINKYANKSQTHFELAHSYLNATTPTDFTDTLTGKSFPIYPAAIFDLSHATKDLKGLFPIAHDTQKTIEVSGQKIPNLEYGKGIKWADYSFAGVLPKADSNNIEFQVKALLRNPATASLANWILLFH